MLFDLDGTLVDTNYLHTLAWSRALAAAGEWAPMNAVHRLVGMGGDQLLPRLLGHPSPRASEERSGLYRQLMPEARAFPGAAELLRALHKEGLVVVLASSSPAPELEQLVDLLGVGDVLDARTTADDVENSKPAPDIFRVAANKAGIDPRRTVAVGDSVWDIEAARGAGIACIAVETGGFSRHELSESGALAVYRDVKELLDQLYTSPIAGLLAPGR